MTTDESEDENPPGRFRPQTSCQRDVAQEHSERDGVLAPLLKSLGWQLVGVGAEFPDLNEIRKPTGRMRGELGREVSAVERTVGSNPTASASRS